MKIPYEEASGRVRDALELAIDQASQSGCHQRHGAILFRGNTIISRGKNEKRPCKWVKSNRKRDFSPMVMHAEISCLHRIDRKKLAGTDLLVVRINNKNKLVNSKPCSTCLFELTRKGIHKIYYSMNENSIGVIDLRAE